MGCTHHIVPCGAIRQSGNSVEYKTVAFPNRWPATEIQSLVSTLNAELEPGVSIEQHPGDDPIAIKLHEVDFRKMKALCHAAAQSSIEQSFADEVIASIESVKSYGMKSGKRLYVNYNSERKVKGRQKKIKKRKAQFYAKSFSENSNEFPEKYRDKFICGDSEEILRDLPDNCIDIVFTSPPYNFGLSYDNASDDADHWEDYFKKLFVIFDQCIRVLKHGGRLVVNIQPLFSDYIPAHHFISSHMTGHGMIWKGEILWEKNNYNCKYTAWGSWKSPSSPYLKYTWEFLEIFCKGDLRKTGAKDNVDITGDEFKKWVYAKWAIAPERKMSEYGHPAMFPEELVRRVLLLFSYQGDIVLDPFMGVGTTGLVAAQLNRHYVGIDVSKAYCEVARSRLRQAADPAR